jgi:alpha-tubulin suppressor-like RCC1 family protein
MGAWNTCARRASGAVACWGDNYYGQIGDGTTVQRERPVLVPGVTDAVEIAVGFHICARRASGAVLCWGQNTFGQVGDGVRGDRTTPAAVTGLTDAVEIAVGFSHTCARRASGGIVCWGLNHGGRLGDGTMTSRSTPVAVVGLTDAVELSAGMGHTCARRMSGEVVCWGHNATGQIGDGTTTDRITPVAVAGLADAVEIVAAGDGGEGDSGGHSCARRASGEVVCWGSNSHGELGDGTTTMRLTPVPVVELADILEVSANGSIVMAPLTCARRAPATRSATILCWGSDYAGQIQMSGVDQLTPAGLLEPRNAVEIDVGGENACARLSTGSIQCWGSNTTGGVGDGTHIVARRPTTVLAPLP